MSGVSSRGQIVTFYSYKGGTGRSMALANVAWILAANGMRVLVIDWDLEAPGLHRYFRPFLSDPDLTETKGLIDVLWDITALQLAATTPLDTPDVSTEGPYSFPPHNLSSEAAAMKRRSSPDFARALMATARRLKRPVAPQSIKRRGPADERAEDPFLNGCIDFVGAGRQSGSYGERVNTFDWRGFYELGGAELLLTAASQLRLGYDWVLIDSRTGVADSAGICTMQLPDKLVTCFTLNRQSLHGVASVLDSVRAWRAARPELPRITYYPLATRIENAEKDRLEGARVYARKLMAEFLPDGARGERDYWDRMEVTYRPWYAYEEVLAPFGDKTGAGSTSDSLLAQMEQIVGVIAGPPRRYLRSEPLRAPEIPPHERTEILRLYAFDARTMTSADAEASEAPGHLDLSDEVALRDIYLKEQYWRQGGRSFRLLLSRGELAFLDRSHIDNMGQSLRVYVDESELVQQWFGRMTTRSLVSVFPTIMLGVGAALAVAFSLRNKTYPDVSTSEFIVYSLAGAVIGWIISGWAATVSSIYLKGLPNSLSVSLVAWLALRGPFQPTIRDFRSASRGQEPLQ